MLAIPTSNKEIQKCQIFNKRQQLHQNKICLDMVQYIWISLHTHFIYILFCFRCNGRCKSRSPRFRNSENNAEHFSATSMAVGRVGKCGSRRGNAQTRCVGSRGDKLTRRTHRRDGIADPAAGHPCIFHFWWRLINGGVARAA